MQYLPVGNDNYPAIVTCVPPLQLCHYTHGSAHEVIFIVVFCIESYKCIFIYRSTLLCCLKMFVKFYCNAYRTGSAQSISVIFLKGPVSVLLNFALCLFLIGSKQNE